MKVSLKQESLFYFRENNNSDQLDCLSLDKLFLHTHPLCVKLPRMRAAAEAEDHSGIRGLVTLTLKTLKTWHWLKVVTKDAVQRVFAPDAIMLPFELRYSVVTSLLQSSFVKVKLFF